LVFNPWVSVLLFACIVLVVIGIYFRLYKLIAPCGLIASSIIIFRMFSSQLFGSYSLFQAKIIIPLFILAMSAKLVSDYMQKKRTAQEELELKNSSRRKSITSNNAFSKNLNRFGEKQSSFEPALDGDFKGSSKSAPPVKLNRSF